MYEGATSFVKRLQIFTIQLKDMATRCMLRQQWRTISWKTHKDNMFYYFYNFCNCQSAVNTKANAFTNIGKALHRPTGTVAIQMLCSVGKSLLQCKANKISFNNNA